MDDENVTAVVLSMGDLGIWSLSCRNVTRASEADSSLPKMLGSNTNTGWQGGRVQRSMQGLYSCHRKSLLRNQCRTTGVSKWEDSWEKLTCPDKETASRGPPLFQKMDQNTLRS